VFYSILGFSGYILCSFLWMVNSFSCFFLFGFIYFHSFEHYAINNKSKIQGNKIHNKIFHNIVRSFVTNYSSGISTKFYRSHSLWIFIHGEILFVYLRFLISCFLVVVVFFLYSTKLKE
jgi:hypothetical protein